MQKQKPNKDYIFSILSYDPESGQLTWRADRGRVFAGQRAGSPNHSRGKTYIQVKIDGFFYKAHQLAWLFCYGEWPDTNIDHIDGNGANNKICNLRKCTMSQNKANSKIYKNNSSGLKGVFFDKKTKKYRVSIQKDKKRYCLGRFNSLDEAAAVYLSKAKELFGDFARAG